MNAEIANNPKQIAYCGLYCAACKRFTNGKCTGCQKNEKAAWCKIRTCNMEHGYASCADCKEFTNPKECSKYNNIFARVIGFVTKSDRPACIAMIREKGYEGFASFMSEKGWQSIKK